MRMPFSETKLPSSFINEVQSIVEDTVIIRSNLRNSEDITKWIQEFGQINNTKWNTRNTTPSGQKFMCSKNFVCHRSAHMKVPPEANKRKYSKSTGCLAKVRIKIKLNNYHTRKKDDFVKKNLLAIIKLDDVHNHRLNTDFFPPTADSKEKFFEYFNNGMKVASAIRHHWDLLEKDGRFSEDEIANNLLLNPPYRTVQYWRSQWCLQKRFNRKPLPHLRPRKNGALNEIAKESDVSTDGDTEHEGSKDGTNKKKRNLLTKKQEKKDPESQEEDTDSCDSPPKKKKPLNPKTKLDGPKKFQRIKKKTKVNIWEYKKEKEASRNSPVDSGSERQTDTSHSQSESSKQSIKLDTSTIKIEKDTSITSDCSTTSEKENQSIISSKCPIEVKKVKLTNLPTCDPPISEKERETILSDDPATSINDTKNSMTSDKPIVNENDTQIIVPSNNSIVSSPEKHTVLHSNDQVVSKSEKQGIRPVTSPNANENQITITTSNVLETQTKEQTITSSNHFQPVIESATSTQNKHFPQVVFLQVKPNFPLLQPGVQLKDFAILPGRIPPSISSGTNTLTANVQSLRNTPTLSGQLIRNGTNSNPILLLRPLDSNVNLPNPTTISIPPKTNSSTSILNHPIEQTKQSFIKPTTEAKLPNTMQNIYIKEEPIDIVEEAYELSDAAMKNSFIPTNQIENSALDQPLNADKCDIGEEINRCYNYAGKLFKRLKSERLSMEDNLTLTANSSPEISPNQSEKRKKRKTESDEFDSDQKQKEDEIDNYCKQVAKRLKTMNSETIVFVQKAIDNLLCDAEVGLGEFLQEKKGGERSLRCCVTPTYITASDESPSPFSLGETSPSGDSESTLTALSDSNVSS